jgi:hypothetical protein
MELAVPQDMQCNPGVAFIPKPMTVGAFQKHPLNHSSGEKAGIFYIRFIPLRPIALSIKIKPTNFKGETYET